MWEELKEKLNISPEIINILTNIYKFDKITKVQYIVINEFLKNQDVIVKSITGSGKTLSYIIPLFQRLIKYSWEIENYKNKILCLILLPSRELSEQVYNDINIFINNIKKKYTCQLLIGGKKIDNDLDKLSNDIPNIIVATPGRLIDIDDKMKLQFNELQLLIIDEADKMLDMGFEMAVSSIISKLPKQRRTGLFSATVTSNVENIIKAGMRNPIFIDIFINGKNNNNIFIENSDLKIKNLGNYGNYYKIIPFSQDNYQINNIKNEVPKGLNQYYRLIKNIKYKIPHLIQILNSLYNTEKNKKIMLFLSTCNSVDYFNLLLPKIFKYFNINDYSIYKLHSKINQNKREKELKDFKQNFNNKINILLTTDLASRGIDIPDIDMIIQFDPPKNEDSYIHKAGRTARVGNSGISLLFLIENELPFITYMKQKFIYIENFPSLLKDETMEDKIDNKSILQCIKDINISDKWIYDKAVNSFVSFIKFYHEIELKYIFDYRQLDLGNLANSFQLLKLPRLKIKEFNNESIKNFEKDNNIVPKDLKYLNSNIEKQMNEKKEKIYLKLNEFHQKKREREEMKINFNKNNEKKINRTRKEKKEAKIRQMIEQWDDLADDELMYKKYKKGKISKEEYEKYLLKIK